MTRPFAVCLLLALPLLGQTSRTETLDHIAAEAFEAARVPGAGYAVLEDGKILHVSSFGRADLEAEVPATPRTRFRTASIAKPITALALDRLARAGKVDLDRDLAEIVPEWPKKRWPVTARLVLGHLGGIRHYRGAEALSARRFRSLAHGLSIFHDDPLEAEPGTKYRYTTYGYNLLGRAVEVASGTDFYSAIEELVLEPTGMRDTVVDDTRRIVPRRTRFYTRRGEAIENARVIDPSYKVPGGGLLTTAEDLARLGEALLGDAYLGAEDKKRLWTSGRTRAGEATGYGLGFGVRRDDAGRLVQVSHSGGQQGTSSLFLLRPRTGRGVVLLTNLDGVGRDLRTLARRLLEALEETR